MIDRDRSDGGRAGGLECRDRGAPTSQGLQSEAAELDRQRSLEQSIGERFPSRCFITRTIEPSCSPTSYTVHICEWFRRAIVFVFRSKQARRQDHRKCVAGHRDRAIETQIDPSREQLCYAACHVGLLTMLEEHLASPLRRRPSPSPSGSTVDLNDGSEVVARSAVAGGSAR